MSYRLIHEYKNSLKNDAVWYMRGPLSPLLMAIPWRKVRGEELPALWINRGRESIVALNERIYFKIATDKFSDFHKGLVTLDELKNEYTNLERKITGLYDELMPRDTSRLQEAEIVSYLQKILALFDEAALRTLYIETLDADKILSVIGEDQKNFLESIWDHATEPTFVSFEGRRLAFLIDLISRNGKDAVHAARYIYTDYVWTKSDEEIQQALLEIKKDIGAKTNECARSQKEADERKRQHDTWKGTLDPKTKALVEYMQLVMYLRDIRKDMLGQILACLVILGTEMTSRAGIDKKYAPHILIYEYLRGAKYLESIQKEIEKRPAGTVILIRPDDSYDMEPCDFDTALAEFNTIILEQKDGIREFKGIIANKGKKRGVVRIVIDPHDNKGFKKGDILVTSMTRPEFIHIMKEAGAVITNEGGITCHAAIVSRELNIPCIIGTKIATNILQNGDIVEVNADTGIVTIL